MLRDFLVFRIGPGVAEMEIKKDGHIQSMPLGRFLNDFQP